MGWKLQLLNWWMPSYLIRRELANVSEQTTGALNALLTKYNTQEAETYLKKPSSRSIQEIRANMAQTQAEQVERLEGIVGHEKAVKLGREAMFLAGKQLGEQTRIKLGVSDNPKDLIKAAKILYRILGIDFHLEWQNSVNATAIITRCPLAEQYSKLTCEVLSAIDEGVIAGLQPNVSMHFQEYMTSGCENCRAIIQFNEKENLI